MKKFFDFDTVKNIQLNQFGLNKADIKSQFDRFGKNIIIERPEGIFSQILWSTIKDPMIWFLVVISMLFYFLGEFQDAIMLIISLVPLVLMDLFLHWRTHFSLKSLKSTLATETIVLRDGIEQIIDSNLLVPGDQVILSKNMILPADGIILESNSLLLDEAILTGESLPCSKKTFENFFEFHKGITSHTFEEKYIANAGTRVLSGSGKLLVLLTGNLTDYSQIMMSVLKYSKDLTPLQISISKLVKRVLLFALFFCFILGFVRILQGKGYVDALLTSSVLAMAAIPEEFPIVFTFFLSIGVFRLAKKGALVRNAISVENIGRVTRICTDKTGTITFGELKLSHLVPCNPFSEDDLLLFSINASNAMEFDPLDQAIINIAVSKKIQKSKVIKVFPFTEERKRECAIVDISGRSFACLKGAPETIFSLSKITQNVKNSFHDKVLHFAGSGHKVIACAVQELKDSKVTEPMSNFNFVGLLSFEDPPRPEAISAIDYCHDQNIKVMMLTGDHAQTAEAIAREIHLCTGIINVVSVDDKPEVFSKEFLTSHPDFLMNVDVVARCRPFQKLMIVEALKKLGEIVAVTGDGINDVPSLKAANISFAMGMRGSQSAKEISNIILSDDNFNTIVDAIKEGRNLYKNLKNSFIYLLLFHIPFVLIAAVIPLLGYPIVFLPIHVVMLELIIHPTAIFAFRSEIISSARPKYEKLFFSKKEFLIYSFTGIVFCIFLLAAFALSFEKQTDIFYCRSQVFWALIFWSSTLVLILNDKIMRSSAILFLYPVVFFCFSYVFPTLFLKLHLISLPVKDIVLGLIVLFTFIVFVKKKSSFIK